MCETLFALFAIFVLFLIFVHFAVFPSTRLPEERPAAFDLRAHGHLGLAQLDQLGVAAVAVPPGGELVQRDVAAVGHGQHAVGEFLGGEGSTEHLWVGGWGRRGSAELE